MKGYIEIQGIIYISIYPFSYAEPVASEGGRRETPTDIETRGSAAPHSIRHPSPSHSPRLAGSAAPSGRKRDEGEWEGMDKWRGMR